MASPAPLAYSSSASADWPGLDCMPVLLLKTRSFPHDPYQELFSTYSLPSASPSPPTSSTIEASFDDGAVRLPPFVPYFVPVLAHRFDHDGTARLRALLHARQIGPHADCVYGGLIFTSQRAVEALADVISDTLRETADGDNPDWHCLHQVPIYSVGSATTRALQAVPHHTPLRVFGDHCGNGDALAHFIRDHYSDWYRHRSLPPPLLFLVGEQRRDIISRTLMDPSRPPSQRILVDEEVVYRTAVMDSFPQDFAVLLRQTERAPVRWIVVFSPTGCDSMLRGIDMLDPATRRAPPAPSHASNTLIATIGPTTRAHLIEIFAFEPHVCADSPSPEGVLQAIVRYMRRPVKSCLTDATT